MEIGDLFGTNFTVWARWEVSSTRSAHCRGHVHDEHGNSVLQHMLKCMRIYLRDLLTPARSVGMM